MTRTYMQRTEELGVRWVIIADIRCCLITPQQLRAFVVKTVTPAP